MDADMTQEDVLKRYPRITAHLICESLGYLTPKLAANWIIAVKEGLPCWCEWSVHMAQGFDEKTVLKVCRETLIHAIRHRHCHKGYMADYAYAREIVKAANKNIHPIFASWF